MVSSEYSNFLQSYIPHQQWSLPSSIIYYITKNPSTSKCYQKLIQSCKYFFIKNPILIIERLEISKKNQWEASSKTDEKCFDLTNILNVRFWITSAIYFYSETPNYISSIFPRFYQNDAKYLTLNVPMISFDEFLFLSANLEVIFMRNVGEVNENGTVVTLEKIVQSLLKLKVLYTNYKVTETTVKGLLDIPHFKTMKKFYLWGITETFDIETLFTHIKKNKQTNFQLLYEELNPLSYACRKKLNAIIDEILETEDHDYEPPYISFYDINYEKFVEMYTRYYQKKYTPY